MLGQHPSQAGPIVKRPSESLGLAEQGEAPLMLSQLGQRISQSEAEIDGEDPRVAEFGQVREGLEGLLRRRATASRNAAWSKAFAQACWQ